MPELEIWARPEHLTRVQPHATNMQALCIMDCAPAPCNMVGMPMDNEAERGHQGPGMRPTCDVSPFLVVAP